MADRLSDQIGFFREVFVGDGKHSDVSSPEALREFDAMFAGWEAAARILEAELKPLDDAPLPIERVIADIEQEARDAQAMADSIARTNAKLQAAAEDNVVFFPSAFRRKPGKPAGAVTVATALAILGGIHNDDGANMRPTFDSPEDCA